MRLIHSLLLAATLGACHHAAEGSEPEPGAILVRCVAPTPRPMNTVRVLRGSTQLAPEGLARVAAQLAGRVQRLAVREGDRVTAGQLLATVETAPMVDQAQAARGALEGARVSLSMAQATVTRLEPLVAHGIAAQQELDDARARVALARAALSTQTGAAHTTARDVGRGAVRSPIAGVVLRVLRGTGELVDGTPATPIVEVGDPSALEFVANATAEDLVALRSGQVASVVLGAEESAGRAARVDRVAMAVDPLNGIGPVRLRLTGDDPVPVGMTGRARVIVEERPAVAALPAGAVRQREGDHGEVVVCGANHHAAIKEVTLGVSDEGFVEVREGLEAGERVVTEHVVGIEDEAALQERP